MNPYSSIASLIFEYLRYLWIFIFSDLPFYTFNESFFKETSIKVSAPLIHYPALSCVYVSFKKTTGEIKYQHAWSRILTRIIRSADLPKKLLAPSSQLWIPIGPLIHAPLPFILYYWIPIQTKPFSIHKTYILIHWGIPYNIGLTRAPSLTLPKSPILRLTLT